MKKKIELPLAEVLYGTYHNQGAGFAALVNNTSIRNWYYNQVMILTCTTKFLDGFTSPEIDIADSKWSANPYLEKKKYGMQYLGGYVHYVIRNLLDAGYYVCFSGVDDYYIEGKSWYGKRHFYHDGLICGYNQEDKTYCIYAYDINWIYRKFWIPQKSFEKGRKSMFKEKRYGSIGGIKPKDEQVLFSAESALKKLEEYLDPAMEKHPDDKQDKVYGIAVHDYIAQYVGKLSDGSIPYEKMDRRVCRLIWEHKKVMLERIRLIETELSLGSEISEKYETVVNAANDIRMLYASHNMKRRDSLLPLIQKKLLEIKDMEYSLLSSLLESQKGDATQ